MQIHLLDISSCDGKTIQESVVPELEKIDFQMGSFPVLAKEPVELTITNTGDKVLELTGTGKITVGIPCDRCLETVAVEIPLEFKKKLDMKLSDEERVNDLDESSYLTGKEDCKGICSRCGKNLNEGPCGCKEEPKDPRMAAISDIFSKFKEV